MGNVAPIIIIISVVVAIIFVFTINRGKDNTINENYSGAGKSTLIDAPINLPFAIAAVTTPQMQKKYNESGLEQKGKEHEAKIIGYVYEMKKYANDFLNKKISKQTLDNHLNELSSKIEDENIQYGEESSKVFGFGLRFDNEYFRKLNRYIFGVENYSDPAKACRKYIDNNSIKNNSESKEYMNNITNNVKKYQEIIAERGKILEKARQLVAEGKQKEASELMKQLPEIPS